MEQITSELLQTIYNRAVQYCVAAYNNGEPDEIHIEEDGSLKAKWNAYHPSYDDDYEYFGVDKLTADLDEVYSDDETKTIVVKDQCTKKEEAQGLLETVFLNGKLVKMQTLEEIRKHLQNL